MLLCPWIGRFTMIISACGFEQATNSVARNQNSHDIGKLETLKQVQIQARHQDSVTGGAEINFGGHEKFIYL